MANFLDTLTKVGSAISPFASIGTGILSSILGSNAADQQAAAIRASNEANLRMNSQTNQANRDIAAMTNNANMQMADKANALQLAMMQQQQDFNRRQSLDERNYNSASAQVQRMLAAGLNPHAVDNAGTYTAAQASLGSSQVGNAMVSPTMQAGHVEPAYGDFSPVVSALTSLSENIHNISDSRTKNAIAKQVADTQQRIADAQIDNLSHDTKIKEWESLHLDDKWSHQLNMDNAQIRYMQDQIAIAHAQVDATIKQIESQYAISHNHETEETKRLEMKLANDLKMLKDQIDATANENIKDRALQQQFFELNKEEFERKHGGFINRSLDYIGADKWLAPALMLFGFSRGRAPVALPRSVKGTNNKFPPASNNSRVQTKRKSETKPLGDGVISTGNGRTYTPIKGSQNLYYNNHGNIFRKMTDFKSGKTMFVPWD